MDKIGIPNDGCDCAVCNAARATKGSTTKIINTHWFTEGSRKEVIGIVISGNEDGIRSVHIGTGAGVDEHRDALHIAKWGARVRPEAVRQFFGQILGTDG